MPDAVVFWLVPLTWLVHDAEELVTLPRWHTRNEAALRALARRSASTRRLVSSLSDSRDTFAVAAVLVGATVAKVSDPDGVGLLVFAVCLGGYGLHGVVHVAQAAVFGGYVPGVVTGVVLVVPTAGYVYWRLLGEGLLSTAGVAGTALGGLVVFLSAVLAATHLTARLRTR
jgi:hypothetical protein